MIKRCTTLHDRPFAANRCPCNGGRPSEPTASFGSAAQGPVTETLCTRLAPPGGSLHAEENRFIPVNAFALCGKWVHFITAARNCQEDWLIGRMKQIHKSMVRICRNLRSTFVKKLLSFWKQALKPLSSRILLCYTAYSDPKKIQRRRRL